MITVLFLWLLVGEKVAKVKRWGLANVAFHSVKECSFTERLTLNTRSQNQGKKVTLAPP